MSQAKNVRRRTRILALLGAIGGLALLAACTPAPSTNLADYASTVRADLITTSDGFVASGDSISAFDLGHPAISNLDPELRDALQTAARDAIEDGVEMFVTAGWRSERYQRVLLEEATRKYASAEEASKWVATPEDSMHVSGNAVDIGPTNAMSWMSQYGAAYGLCQTYANEMWHFELTAEPGGICPAAAPDASQGRAGGRGETADRSPPRRH